jgi:hypothetical protein
MDSKLLTEGKTGESSKKKFILSKMKFTSHCAVLDEFEIKNATRSCTYRLVDCIGSNQLIVPAPIPESLTQKQLYMPCF